MQQEVNININEKSTFLNIAFICESEVVHTKLFDTKHGSGIVFLQYALFKQGLCFPFN
jgi:hypothetical protein